MTKCQRIFRILAALIAMLSVVGLMGLAPLRSMSHSGAASQRVPHDTAALSGTLVVISSADTGSGTLRQQIMAAQPGDTIIFDPAVFPSDIPVTINVQSPLPTLSRSNVTIDASNAGVILDGSQAGGGADGFVIGGDGCVIRGLTIRNFSGAGILLTAGAASNVIGGNRLMRQGNIIAGNGASGIDMQGAGTVGNYVWGNQIGVDAAGVVDWGNAYNGIAIWQGANNNTIGSAGAGYTNTIGGNQQNGIWISGVGTNQNIVIGNHFGARTDAASAVANGYSGIALQDGAQFNRIGGEFVGERNLISGNADNGIYIGGVGTNYNQVLGNFIGVNAAGTGKIGQGTHGILITQGASHNAIGNGTPGGRNLIGGNAQVGVRIQDAATMSNTVQGNFIGTNLNGTAAIPNGLHGVELTYGTSGNLIGGRRLAGRGNLISGNYNHGIVINFSAHHNVVAGNLLGPDVTGSYSLGNHPYGAIDITDAAHHNTLGGLQPDEGNIVSGNQTDGIALFDTSDNQLIGNLIGLTMAGTAALPNGGPGIFNVSGAVRTLLMSNTIAYNPIGVWITECAGNTIAQNSIYSNTSKGIVVEHSCAPVPQVTAVTTVTLTGVTTPLARVELFSDNEDQGRAYEGFTMADASGYFTFTKPAGFANPNVLATSTDVNGGTSEFSRPVHLLWTVLLYLNGDNNLEDDLHETVNNLVAAGPSPRANVLVLIDGYTNTQFYTGTALYDITYGQVTSITTQLGPTLTVPSELNLGDGQTLAEFVKWGRDRYPARYTMLSIVDHGGGWAPSVGPDVTGTLKHQDVWLAGNSGLSWDYTDNYDYLNSPELKQAFAFITNDGTKPVDIVFYDVCLMGMLEVAYQIKDYASIFVSSQNIGWSPVGPQGRYVEIVRGITPDMTPLEFGRLIVSAYADALPPNEHPFTISALDLTQLPAVSTAVNQLGMVFSQALTSSVQVNTLHEVYSATQKVDYDGDFYIEPATDGFVDLYDLAVQTSQRFTNTGLIAAAQAVTQALSAAVITEQHRSGSPWLALDRAWDLDNAHGLSIFLPLGEDLELPLVITETSPITPGLEVTRNLRLRELYSSSELQFVGDTSWGNLINAYYQAISVTATTKDAVPVGGLLEPDVAAPRTIITATGTPVLGSMITLTWEASDLQPGSGVGGAAFWHRPPSGQWTPLLTQTNTSGLFLFTVSAPCLNGLAVRAVDKSGNIEAVSSGSNTIFIDVPYCRFLPVISRQ